MASKATSRNHKHQKENVAGTKIANGFINKEFGKKLAKAEGYWGNSWYHTGALTELIKRV